eukprot:12906790-Prorocentrum_lima.AAC.1
MERTGTEGGWVKAGGRIDLGSRAQNPVNTRETCLVSTAFLSSFCATVFTVALLLNIFLAVVTPDHS